LRNAHFSHQLQLSISLLPVVAAEVVQVCFNNILAVVVALVDLEPQRGWRFPAVAHIPSQLALAARLFLMEEVPVVTLYFPLLHLRLAAAALRVP